MASTGISLLEKVCADIDTPPAGKVTLFADSATGELAIKDSGAVCTGIGPSASPVQSVFGRTGAVTALQADYDAFFTTPAEAAAAAPVQSVFGRTGAVTALAADYDAFFLTPAEGDAVYGRLAAVNTWTQNNIFNGGNIVIGAAAEIDAGVRLQAVGAASEFVMLLRANATPGTAVLAIQSSAGASSEKFMVNEVGRVNIGNTAFDTTTYVHVGRSAAHPLTTTTVRGVVVDYITPTTATALSTPLQAKSRIVVSHPGLTEGAAIHVDDSVVGAGGLVTTLSGLRIRQQGAAGVTNAFGIFVTGVSGADQGTPRNVGVRIDASTTAALWLSGAANTTDITGGIAFGSSLDTQLFRQAANVLTLGDGDSFRIIDANIILSSATGTKIGTATGEKLAFHNSTPVIQRAGAAQAAVATTAATQTTPWGYSTQAQADGIITLLNEIRATLVEKGLMKGAA